MTDHLTLAELLELMDTRRARRIAGAEFTPLRDLMVEILGQTRAEHILSSADDEGRHRKPQPPVVMQALLTKDGQ